MSTENTEATEVVEDTATAEEGVVEETTEEVVAEGQEATEGEATESEDGQVEQEGEEAEEGEQDAPAAEPTGVLRVKINGEEKDFDLTDAASLEEVSKLISHSAAANKRMQEATQMQQQSMEFLRLLQENPVDILTNPQLGINFREIAENYLIEQLKLDDMDEDSRTRYQKAKDYDQMVKQQEYQKQQQEQQNEARAVEELRVQLTTEIENSIMESGMPLNDTTFGQVRALMLTAAQAGEKLDAPDAVAQLAGVMKTLVAEGNDDSLAKILGEENVKRVAKKKAPKEKVVAKEDQGEPRTKKSTKKKKMTTSEFRASLGI